MGTLGRFIAGLAAILGGGALACAPIAAGARVAAPRFAAAPHFAAAPRFAGARRFAAAPRAAVAPPEPVAVTVEADPVSPPIRPGFVGVSFELWALPAYAGGTPRTVNPVLVQLIRNLAPRQSPVIRIGGDSTDTSWWPVPGITPPPPVSYRLTAGWMRMARALATALHARLLLGVNLEANDPRIAAGEASAFASRIGRSHIEAFEIGNEPDLYDTHPWYSTPGGRPRFGRPPGYSIGSLIRQFSRWRAALPRVPVAGPALATVQWMDRLGRFLAREPEVRLATVHRYPLSSCERRRIAPDYPTLDHLLSAASTAGLAAPLARYVEVARAHHARLRVAEMNSVSCRGKRGVSNTFASALWALDALFELARVGVAGVNVHTLPGAEYELFTCSRGRAFVHPEYYGLELFARAAPPGSRLLAVQAPAGMVRAWATRGPRGTLRMVLINLSPRARRLVLVRVPRDGGVARLQLLRARGLHATAGVTLAGQTYGWHTSTGRLRGPRRIAVLLPVDGNVYSVLLPPASAALLTR